MKTLIVVFLGCLLLPVVLAACALEDAAQRVFEEDARTTVDEAGTHHGFVASESEFSLTQEDGARKYRIVGALRDGKMVLLRIATGDASQGAKRAEILHYGSYRVVGGELKTVQNFGCGMEARQRRDFYFEVAETDDGFELREISLDKLVTPPSVLQVRSDWSLVSDQQILPAGSDGIGCVDAAEDAAAQPYVADIAALLAP